MEVEPGFVVCGRPGDVWSFRAMLYETLMLLGRASQVEVATVADDTGVSPSRHIDGFVKLVADRLPEDWGDGWENKG